MKFALDIGNSRIKGAALNDQNVMQGLINTPSAINRVADKKFLNFTDDKDYYIRVASSALKHYDEIIATGDKAIALPDYSEYDVSTSSYKTNHPITTSLLFGAIAEFIPRDVTEINVKLAVSIPIVESKTVGLTKEYKELLEGDHKIVIYREDGEQTVIVHVERAAIANEGQAGFYGLLDTVDKTFRSDMDAVYRYLGETGDPIPTLENFLVCDIGEGTTDISVFRNKKFNPAYSFSITRGIGSILEDAMDVARTEKLTIESRKDLQSVLESTSPRQQKRKEKWEQYVRPEENAFIETIVDTIMKAYGDRDYYDAIIFFGGGFSALTGYRVDFTNVAMTNGSLFAKLNDRLEEMNKDADLIFGVPAPYSRTINQRGLTQIATTL